MDSLARLFGSNARLKLLRLFVFNRTTAYSPQEAAKRARISLEETRSELAYLERAGIMRKGGRRASPLHRLDQGYVHLEALSTFIRSTSAISYENLLSRLKKAGNLRLVVLSGMFTGVTESRVDLLVVGDRLNERLLARVAQSIEAELGREVRYAAFGTEDFSYRMSIYDRLIRDVFDYPHHALLDRREL